MQDPNELQNRISFTLGASASSLIHHQTDTVQLKWVRPSLSHSTKPTLTLTDLAKFLRIRTPSTLRNFTLFNALTKPRALLDNMSIPISCQVGNVRMFNFIAYYLKSLSHHFHSVANTSHGRREKIHAIHSTYLGFSTTDGLNWTTLG